MMSGLEPSPNIVIVDIDGTLALRNGRSPFEYSLVETDTPNTPIVKLVQTLYESGMRIVVVSGREDSCRLATTRWLDEHLGFSTELHMRPTGDYRPDHELKEEIFRRSIVSAADVLFVLDDRQRTVDLWRRLGLTTLQVAPGDF